jgi:hypothetical protein
MAGSVAGPARPNPQNQDARSDRAEPLNRPGWTVPFEMFGDIILTRDIPELGCVLRMRARTWRGTSCRMPARKATRSNSST